MKAALFAETKRVSKSYAAAGSGKNEMKEEEVDARPSETPLQVTANESQPADPTRMPPFQDLKPSPEQLSIAVQDAPSASRPSKSTLTSKTSKSSRSSKSSKPSKGPHTSDPAEPLFIPFHPPSPPSYSSSSRVVPQPMDRTTTLNVLREIEGGKRNPPLPLLQRDPFDASLEGEVFCRAWPFAESWYHPAGRRGGQTETGRRRNVPSTGACVSRPHSGGDHGFGPAIDARWEYHGSTLIRIYMRNTRRLVNR